jgi:uncharacterized cupredoxin-like copper-binding protein
MTIDRLVRAFKSLVVVTAALPAGSPTSAAAPVTVQVHLIDLTIELSTDQAKAGTVTFQVSNHTEALEHELLVVKTNLPLDALPYDQEKDEIEEDRLNVLGEVEDLYPGESVTLTLEIAAGQYILLCNKAHHFKAGMAHRFTVIP